MGEQQEKQKLDYFDSFWATYPRRVAKTVAKKYALKIQSEKWPEIMNGLKRQLPKFKQMIIEGKKEFIPHPGTWLHQERWEDEIEIIEEFKDKYGGNGNANGRDNRSFFERDVEQREQAKRGARALLGVLGGGARMDPDANQGKADGKGASAIPSEVEHVPEVEIIETG